MHSEPNAHMSSFDGAGLFSGVKILKCKDAILLSWIGKAVRTLSNLQKSAKLEVVDGSNNPSRGRLGICVVSSTTSDSGRADKRLKAIERGENFK